MRCSGTKASGVRYEFEGREIERNLERDFHLGVYTMSDLEFLDFNCNYFENFVLFVCFLLLFLILEGAEIYSLY